jgi:two-component system chemotaxis sensor kinase CheA
MLDPIIHLVRNAVSHGTEAPPSGAPWANRRRARSRLAASSVGDTVMIEVSDDGRGVNGAGDRRARPPRRIPSARRHA